MKLVCCLMVLLSGMILGHQGYGQEAEQLYLARCAACHETPDPDADNRAPARTELVTYSPNTIYNALTDGVMRIQASGLSNAQSREIAQFLTGSPVSDIGLEITSGLCENNPPFKNPALSPQWNGWGPDTRNSRAALSGGVTANDLPRLKLKWAYGLPGESQPRAQPAIVDGRLFVGNRAGALYSLNAETGCTYWSYLPRSGIRSALSVGPVILPDGSAGYAVYFVDIRANAYAVNAKTGEEIWVTNVESHPGVRGTGSVTLHNGRLYVPATGVLEETSSSGPDYPCCTFRGSISSLDAHTGEVIWKYYTIPEPQPRGLSSTGVQLYGPAGVGIWSAPTIDENRGLLYASTGNAYADPDPETADAIIALEMATGNLVWVNQLTPGDVFIGGCDNESTPNCPRIIGPDFDFSASPILTATPSGRELLVVPQKSGMAYALDPNNQGAKVWEYRAGNGGRTGGVWGMSVAEGMAYVAVGGYNDPDSGGIHGINIENGEGVWFTPPQDLLCGAGFGCRSTQSAAVTAIPGAVFSGSADGGMRAYSAVDGQVLWTFDTNPSFETVNGVLANGGSLDGPGPVVAGGMVYFLSGNCCIVGRPGNILFAFELSE